MLKLSENPPTSSVTAGGSLRDWSDDWWVVHTKARFEKALAWELLKGDINYFLPMAERITVSSGKKRRGMAALFPSYLFFCGTREQRLTVFATGRVCQVIPVKEREKFVDELSALEQALKAGVKLDPYPELVPGRRCRVKKGPLEGIQGTVLSKDETLRLILQVSMLGQGASLEVPADFLEPLE